MRYLLLMILATAAGCQSPSVTPGVHEVLPAVAGDDVRLYFFRAGDRLLSTAPPVTVRLDGKDLGRLGQGEFFCVDLPPGEYELTCDMPSPPVAIATNAGQHRYFQVTFRKAVFTSARATIQAVSADRAASAMRSGQYLGAGHGLPAGAAHWWQWYGGEITPSLRQAPPGAGPAPR